ncbi:alpha/beta fold hydrolase [Gordonia sp. 135]|uniref:alpha/beta fold hydrolase n=1 Tax=Gordonia sp. 135 TaxID=2676309 RepID=UPI0012BB38B1|nr:alpha/beta hydrolase [Gordonia sp. 135]QGP86943.1 alpha/beta fold hydrolase [Gordonia sp. 135]
MRTVHVGDEVDGGTYVDVAGTTLWHFSAGDPQGTPTVLLHGIFASAASWGAQIPDFLDAGLRLFLPERPGHGHSPDVDGNFTCASIVARTIAYLETVVGRPANIVGWADGAAIALVVARDRPDLVNRVVYVGGYLNSDGRRTDRFVDLVLNRNPTTVEYLRTHHDETSPDGPEHFSVVYDKTILMLSAEPDYAVADFADVRTPTLVVAADRGLVRMEHALDIVRTLPNARFAVLPGTHIMPVEAPELFNPLVLSFLAADPPTEWLPE